MKRSVFWVPKSAQRLLGAHAPRQRIPDERTEPHTARARNAATQAASAPQLRRLDSKAVDWVCLPKRSVFWAPTRQQHAPGDYHRQREAHGAPRMRGPQFAARASVSLHFRAPKPAPRAFLAKNSHALSVHTRPGAPVPEPHEEGFTARPGRRTPRAKGLGSILFGVRVSLESHLGSSRFGGALRMKNASARALGSLGSIFGRHAPTVKK